MDLDEPQVEAAAAEEEVVEMQQASEAEPAAVKGKKGWPKGIARPPKKATTGSSAAAAGAPGTSPFPISRVAKIVKADKDIAMCQKEAIFLMSIATVRAGFKARPGWSRRILTCLSRNTSSRDCLMLPIRVLEWISPNRSAGKTWVRPCD